MSIDDYEGLRQIYFEEVETVVVDGVEHTFKTPNYRTETIEEREQRLLKAKEHKTKKELEFEEVMATINLNKHTRMPILDSNEVTHTFDSGRVFTYNQYFYRFETDEEMKERIAKDKLGKSDRGDSWKDLVIIEMTYHNDSWDQVIATQVKCENYEKSVKDDDAVSYTHLTLPTKA